MESTKTYNEIYQRWEWKNSQGQYHRENDLPAIEKVNGDKFWYLNGQYHRADGPAVIWPSGYGDDEYWYHGKPIKCKSTEEFVKLIKLQAFW